MNKFELLFLLFVLGLMVYWRGEVLGRMGCPLKLIAVIHRCEATGCEVLLPDGTKGKTTKWPVEFGKESEVCQ